MKMKLMKKLAITEIAITVIQHLQSFWFLSNSVGAKIKKK
jgi:hypothetical protein